VNQPHREMGHTRSLPTADRCIPVMPRRVHPASRTTSHAGDRSWGSRTREARMLLSPGLRRGR
jgi:hypothetical protein